MDLSKLDSQREGQRLEFKQSFGREALETIGAFANAEGGDLLIGVRDDGHVVGLTIGQNTLEEWAQKIQGKVQPRLLPSMSVQTHGGRAVVVVTVERSDAPVCVDGRFIKRVGPTNQIMGPEEVRQRLLTSGRFTWDSKLEEGATLADLDEEKVWSFIARLKKLKRRPVPEDSDVWSVLDKLKLTEYGQPTRAALLLFGKSTRNFYPLAYIKAGRFRSPIDIVDDKEFHGGLFEQIENTMSWFRDRLETRLVIGQPKISGSLAEREEIWQYPLAALREAVINAVCHRNYWSNAATTIRLYDDHVEIWNPGNLAAELTPEKLLEIHNSHPPNRLIAEAFFNTGIIERWGTGTLLIARSLATQGLPPPVFDASSQHTFKVIMHGEKRIMTSALEAMELNDRQIKVMQYLKHGQTLTNAEYQALVDTSKATATRDLAELVSKGLIFREGITGKGTIYRLAEP